MWLPWRRRQLSARLSAYLDGELDRDAADEVSDRIVLEPEARALLDGFATVDHLVERALAPVSVPDWADAADSLLSRCRAAGCRPAAAAALPRRRHLAPAALAALGVLLTAGVTFLGLRRRGLV